MLKRFIGEMSVKVLNWSRGSDDSAYKAHFEREWAIAFPKPDEMQDMVKKNVEGILSVFAMGGHSGFSAAYTIGILEKLLRFQPLSPLTGADDEWTVVAEEEDGSPVFQNKRESSVFKEGIDGRAYTIDGTIYTYPDGVSYTKGGERNYIEFPWTKPEPVTVYVDEDGEPLESETVEASRSSLVDIIRGIDEAASALADIVKGEGEEIEPVDETEDAIHDARDILGEDMVSVPRDILAAASYALNKGEFAGTRTANKIREFASSKKDES